METNPTTETIINALNPALAPWGTKAIVADIGGGCAAIVIDVPTGGEIIITDAEDGIAPDASTTSITVGLYGDDHGDPIRHAVVPVLDLGTLSFTLDAFLLGQ